MAALMLTTPAVRMLKKSRQVHSTAQAGSTLDPFAPLMGWGLFLLCIWVIRCHRDLSSA